MENKQTSFTIPPPIGPNDAVTIASMFEKIQKNLIKLQEAEDQKNGRSLPNQQAPYHYHGESEDDKPSMKQGKTSSSPKKTTLFASQLKLSMAASASVVPSSEEVASSQDPEKAAKASKFYNPRLNDYQRVDRSALPFPKPDVKAWTFDRPTFGQDFCASTREGALAAISAEKAAGKRKAGGMGPSTNLKSRSTLWDDHIPLHGGFGWGNGFGTRQPTKEEIDDFCAFADKWIPTPKRCSGNLKSTEDKAE